MTRTPRSQTFSCPVATLGWLLLLAPPARATPDVQIGRCASIGQLIESRDSGFDYVELPVRAFATLSEAEFNQALIAHREAGLPTPVGNLFVPSEIRLTGPDTDAKKQRAYVATALDRARKLGLRIVVFGSGGARRVPEGFPRERAWKQLVAFGRMAAREAKKRGITVAVEPLRQEESNIINTAAEGLALVKAIDHPGFALMVDLYHLASENEDPSIIVKAKQHIRHFHIANPEGRAFPSPGDRYDYGPFFAAIRQIGYSGGISVEATSKDYANEAPRTIALLRALAAGALAAPAARP